MNAKYPVVICVSGLAGSGKSTVAKRLAKKYRLKYLSGGDALKALAQGENLRQSAPGWWEKKEGLDFLRERRVDASFDQLVDERLLKAARKGNVVLDSWTMPWLLRDGFKIWLEASIEKRASRIASRDGMTVDAALKALIEKEKQTKAIYKKLYHFELGKDLAPFDFVLDTETLDANEVYEILDNVIAKVIFKRQTPNSHRSRTHDPRRKEDSF